MPEPRTIILSLILYSQLKQDCEEAKEDLIPYIDKEILDLPGKDIAVKIGEALIHQR